MSTPIRHLAVIDGPSLAPGDYRQANHVIALTNLQVGRLLLAYASNTGNVAQLAPYGASDIDGEGLAQFIPENGMRLTVYAIEPTPIGDLRTYWQQWADEEHYPSYIMTVGERGGVKVVRA